MNCMMELAMVDKILIIDDSDLEEVKEMYATIEEDDAENGDSDSQD